MSVADPQIITVFCAALECGSSTERAAYLEEACGLNADLRSRVEALLQAHGKAGDFLGGGPAATGYTDMDEDPARAGPGTMIGPYKLLEQVGEGGFGVVFMAEQQQPIRRRVALKILKPGMDSRQVVARFEAERQALALMDHPNIARVLDGGETASGRPYFVMELVRGVPITDFCDQSHLTARQRLDLFVLVCQAVQHAHQKGIIHRDLKPSNILVTLHDGIPVPKVIDFGIAKATGQQLTDKTLFTNFAQMIGTPMYISPEQAQMSGLDIDTRTDVYALGVLLYELLTGTTPFDQERLRTAGYDEMRRIIREEEPPRPSTRISTLGQAASTVSGNRQSDQKRLKELFRGELDWIVMKALEKDRNRRYETASAFAADVQRFLKDEPVQACPPSTWYRFRKLARRNKRAFATAFALALAVLLAVISLAASNFMIRQEQGHTEQAKDHAEKAQKLAEQRADELRVALERLQSANALIRQEQTRTQEEKERAEKAQKLAEQRANEIRDGLERFKSANVLLERGRLYIATSRWDDAHAALTTAVHLRPDHAAAWGELADLHTRLGLWELAATDLTRELELREPDSAERWYRLALLRLYLGDSPAYCQAARNMRIHFRGASNAFFLAELVRTCVLGPDANADLEQLVELAQQAVASHSPHWFFFYVLGIAHYRAGQHEQAVHWLRTSLESAPATETVRALNYPILAMAHHRLGQTAEARQNLKAAAQALDQWTEDMYRKPGDGHWVHHLGAAGYWPIVWWDWVECRLFYREAKLLIDGSPPPDDPRVRVLRGRAFAGVRGHFRAEMEYAAALQRLPRDPQIRLEAHRNRGYACIQFRQWRKAAAEFAEAAELQPDEVYYGLFSAVAHLAAGEAESYRRRCVALVERFEKTSDPDIARNAILACVLRQDALPDMARLLPLARTASPPNHFGPPEAGAALYRAGKYDEAVLLFEAAAKMYRPRALAWCFLAMAHHRLGHGGEARRALAEAVRWIDEANHEKSDDPAASRAAWGNWHEQLEFPLLLDEAKKLIQPNSERAR